MLITVSPRHRWVAPKPVVPMYSVCERGTTRVHVYSVSPWPSVKLPLPQMYPLTGGGGIGAGGVDNKGACGAVGCGGGGGGGGGAEPNWATVTPEHSSRPAAPQVWRITTVALFTVSGFIQFR